MVRRLRRALLPGVLVLAAAAAAVGAGYLLRTPLPVLDDTTATVGRGPVTVTVAAEGTVASATTASPAFAVDGTVAQVGAVVGRTVRRGDVLATLVDDTSRARLAATTAANDAARRELQAARTPAAPAPVPPAPALGPPPADPVAVARAEAAVAATSADVAAAARTQDATTVVAPQDGTVTAVRARPGERASGPVADIVDVDALQVTVAVPGRVIAGVTTGQTARVVVDGAGPAPLTGLVSAVAATPVTPAADPARPTAPTYATTIALDAAPPALRVGQLARAAITVAEAPDTLFVPRRAVTPAGPDGRPAEVLRRVGGRDERVAVRPGLADDTDVQILGGLRQGDVVVVPAAGSGAVGTPVGATP